MSLSGAQDLQLTLPPIRDWTDDQLRMFHERAAFIALCLRPEVALPRHPRR